MSRQTKTELKSDQRQARKTRSRPFLYLVIEGERPLAGGVRLSLENLDEVLVGRSDDPGSRQITRDVVDKNRRLTLKVGGEFHSRKHALFRSSSDGWSVQDLGSRNGVSVNRAPIDRPTVLSPGSIIGIGRLFFIFDFDEVDEIGDLDLEDLSHDRPGFLTLLPSFERKLSRLRREALQDSSITLTGETGTGKEILTTAIHAESGRKGPYLAVNCGALPRELIQSELFGSLKGAYTGADKRNGYVRDAHLGTLLLDEVVAAPEEVQVSLLRVIQERAVVPIGGTRPQPVDVRFICAAQRPLADEVKAGRFREDLRQRVEAFSFRLPPLRERRPDIGTLVASSLKSLGVLDRDKILLTPKAVWRLLFYGWPGNIRELAQKVRVSLAGANDGEIDDADLPDPADHEPTAQSTITDSDIFRHLRATRGNVAQAAERMGRSRWSVYDRLKKIGVDPGSFRGGR